MQGVKKKRVTKKNKQSWRKHVDIKDVEEYLEEKRTDDRLGNNVEILANKDLFQIDTKPQSAKQISRKEKKKLLEDTVPKCFSALVNKSKIPDPIAKRNRVRTKEERKSKIRKDIEEKQRLKGVIKERDRLAKLNREKYEARKKATAVKRRDFKKDLWEFEDASLDSLVKNEWNEEDTIRNNLRGLNSLPVKRPKSMSAKTSAIPTIEVPHPGASYNPNLTDHQSLLQKVASKEITTQKDEKRLKRLTSDMFRKVSPQKQQKMWLNEMSQGLPALAQKKTRDSDDEGEYKAVNPPVENVKKTRKQRRKQKEQHELDKLKKLKKVEKKKVTDIYKLRQFGKEISEEEQKLKKVQEKREEYKKNKKWETKQLSSVKFEEPDPEFNLSSELSGNLRNIRTAGNLLADRFKSMQKRNIVQPSVKHFKVNRPTVKVYVKSTHRMKQK